MPPLIYRMYMYLRSHIIKSKQLLFADKAKKKKRNLSYTLNAVTRNGTVYLCTVYLKIWHNAAACIQIYLILMYFYGVNKLLLLLLLLCHLPKDHTL